MNNYIKRLSVKCKVFNQIILDGINQNLPEFCQMHRQNNFSLSCLLQEVSLVFVIFNVWDVSTFCIHQNTMALMSALRVQPHIIFLCMGKSQKAHNKTFSISFSFNMI